MANWSDLKASVAEVIKTNGNQKITGQILQNALSSIISNLGENATFAGVATPETNPGTPDGNVFYLASEPGIYSNFNGLQLQDGLYILIFDGDSWASEFLINSSNYQGVELCIKRKGGYSYLNNNGVVTSGGNGYNFITDYIPTSNIKALKYKLAADGSNVAVIAAYDSGKTFIQERSIISTKKTDIKKGLYIVDESVAYVRICYNTGLSVSCITSPQIPYIYEEDVNELFENLNLTANKVTDENKNKAQDIINKETDIAVSLAKIRGLSPYGILLTKEDFVLRQNYGNDGSRYSSSTFVSTHPIKVKWSSFFNYLYSGNSLTHTSAYNGVLFWADDPEVSGYSGDNKLYNFSIPATTNEYSKNVTPANISNDTDYVFVSFTIPAANLSNDTVVSFGMLDNYIKEQNDDLDFMLGSLKKRANLVSEVLDGYQVTGNQITTAGGANNNTYVAKVESGKTYYFYDVSGALTSLNWATRSKNKLMPGERTLHYGTGNSATMQDGDEYLYVNRRKQDGVIMISDSEQTQYYEPENTPYLDLRQLKEENENNPLFQTPINSLVKNIMYKDYIGSDYTVGEVTNTSQISAYTDYMAKGGSGLNPIFRYSSPACNVSDVYPYTAVKDFRTPSLGFAVEFYCTASSFEIIGFTNTGANIIVDGKVIGNVSGTVNNTNYIYVNLGTATKRHIRLLVSSNSFVGIRCNNNGKVIAFKKKRFLCAFDGDSVVEGSNSGQKASRWVELASSMNDLDCFNCAMGGTGYGKDLATSNRENMIDRFEEQIAAFNPDILVVSAGINDADDGFETYVDNYYSQAKSLLPDCRICVCSNYFNKTDSDSNWSKAEAKCEILRNAALRYELPFIDYLHRMTYDALGNVITDNYGTERYTNLITEDNYSQFIDADTDVTHPTKYGHNVMGKYIGNELHKVMAFGFI